GVSFNTSLVAAIRASVKALRSSGLNLAWKASCAYAEPATKRTVTSPTTDFNIGISLDVTGFKPSNMQNGYWLQRNTKRIEFRVDVDRFSSRVDAFSSRQQDSCEEDHGRGRGRQLVSWSAQHCGKEDP